MRETFFLPMNKAQLVYRLNCKGDLSHVESGDVLGEDLILDEHCHQVTSRKKLHEHVKKCRILEGGVQLHKPWAVGICKNVALSTYVSELVLLVLRVC